MKYHIFIGSTLDDLKSERKELVRIVMELGHIPVMADYLDSSAKNASGLLQKIIEECDYFIALVAHKYKSTGGEILPLIAECSAAANKGIPVLALVIDEKARWKPVKREKDAAPVRKLNEFKNKLRNLSGMSGSCESWLNTPDLCQKTQTLLIQQMCVNAQSGWVKSDCTIKPAVANELSRLSCENTVLRRRVFDDESKLADKLHDDQKHVLKMLALNKVPLSFYYASGENWENTRQLRAVRIFKLLVPELSLGKSTSEISRFLGTVLNPDLGKALRKDYPTPSNTVKKIMMDFEALNLVRCVNGREVKAGEEIWEISDYGKELYSVYRVRQLEKVLIKK